MEEQDYTAEIRSADALYADGRLDAALAAYRRALDQNNNIAWAHSRVGAILAQRNDLQGAEAALLRAIELEPRLPQAHSNLGNVYYARGEYEKALAKYREAVAIDPSNPTFHENLHAAYKRLGKLTEAVSHLKQAHRLERDLARIEARKKLGVMKAGLARGRGCLSPGVMILLLAILLLVALKLI